MRIGVDTGGTFTDFIYKDEKEWGVYKILSTPHDPAEAVLKGIAHIAQEKCPRVVHGSTVATNAILERKGAKTALITNKGFEDMIEIGRQNRSILYSFNYQREPHLVPRELRFGVGGRILATGEEEIPFDEVEAWRVAEQIVRLGVESVAVSFLFSFLNESHEKRMGEILSEWGLSVSLSHQILAEFREFERTSTTLINAYVAPVMHRYIGRIANTVNEENLVIMQSNGGRINAKTAMHEPVRTILSGPAGGAVGAFEMGRAAGFERLITFDMGGTSTDVSLIDGVLPLTVDSEISTYPVRVPVIDIHTVGAGGGSIARIDKGGALTVGPESAGADPGPICYGKGAEITVTDANLFLGRLLPEYFLGGNMTLNEQHLLSHFDKLAKLAQITSRALAEGICAVANTAMERAIRVISVERGFDPREFTLVSFGGAGGMHAVFLAQLLNMPRVLVPRNCGILSAMGMLMADVIRNYSQTVMITEETADAVILQELFSQLEMQGLKGLVAEGLKKENIFVERYLDMRYQGQSYEIMVPFDKDFVQRFHAAHEKRYGYRNEGKKVEIVNVRLQVRGVSEKPELKKAENPVSTLLKQAKIGIRDVIFDSEVYAAAIYDRTHLRYGNKIEGPAIVIEYSSTIVLPPHTRGTIDALGNLIIEIESKEEHHGI